MTANDTVSQVVERELTRRGWQRRQLAARLGHHPSWVTMKIKGDRRWSVDDLDQVAQALDVPVAALLMAPREVAAITLRYLRRLSVTGWYPTRRTLASHISCAAA